MWRPIREAPRDENIDATPIVVRWKYNNRFFYELVVWVGDIWMGHREYAPIVLNEDTDEFMSLEDKS